MSLGAGRRTLCRDQRSRREGDIAEFVTSGITEEERAKIGHIPYGRGLLGVLLHEGSGLRLADMAKDPRSGGFPPNHPPMKSLLGMPVVSRGRDHREPLPDR